MKLCTIVGARPQFVKAAALSRAIASFNQKHGQKLIDEKIIHTGQHYDTQMSDIFFEELEIPKPSVNLGIGNCSHGVMTGRMIEAIENVVKEYQPDFLMLYGDTNSTLSGAVVGAKLNVKLAHVEAGLRSFNPFMPEEINRVIADRVSDFLFCPTEAAVKNLKREGASGKVLLVGDVMYDASLHFKNIAMKSTILDDLELSKKPYAVCTIHRAENSNDIGKMKEIFHGLGRVSKEIKIVLPMHPRIRKVLSELPNISGFSNLMLIEPVSYLGFTRILSGSEFVITDSGGVQKEAFFHRKPCITLREETEWVETVELGANRLVGANEDEIFQAYQNLTAVSTKETPYGNGSASTQILQTLTQFE